MSYKNGIHSITIVLGDNDFSFCMPKILNVICDYLEYIGDSIETSKNKIKIERFVKNTFYYFYMLYSLHNQENEESLKKYFDEKIRVLFDDESLNFIKNNHYHQSSFNAVQIYEGKWQIFNS